MPLIPDQAYDILESMPDGLLVIDQEGYLIFGNAVAEQLLGRSHDALNGHPVGEALAGLPFVKHYQRVVAEQVAVRFEAYSQPLAKWLEVQLFPLHSGSVAAALRDVTAYKQLEAELRESESRFRGTFEQAAIGLAHIGLDGRFLRVNDYLCAILGYNRQTLLTLTLRDITHLDDIEDDLSRMAWLLAGEASTYRMEKRYLRSNGIPVWVILTMSLVRDQANTPQYFIKAVEDISERKRLEQQRMDILRTVVHDLNAPLAVAKLSLERSRRLQQRATSGESDASGTSGGVRNVSAGEDWMGPLVAAIARMQRLVRDLATVTQSQTGHLLLHMRQVELRGLCQREVQLFRSATGREVQLVLPEDTVEVKADEEALGRVMSNLLSNANKYSPAEKSVMLSLTQEEGDLARVSVRDEGLGIPSDEQQHIWEPFHRVAGAHEGIEGLGLGLAICKALVEQHGGEIGVESEVGQGSTFWFTVPCHSG